jgi:hypothetical protein
MKTRSAEKGIFSIAIIGFRLKSDVEERIYNVTYKKQIGVSNKIMFLSNSKLMICGSDHNFRLLHFSKGYQRF